MNHSIIALAGLLLTTACATQQPPQMVDAERRASLQCQYALADNDYNYDAFYLASGQPAVDDNGHPNGLSLRGYVAYGECMAGKGYDIP